MAYDEFEGPLAREVGRDTIKNTDKPFVGSHGPQSSALVADVNDRIAYLISGRSYYIRFRGLVDADQLCW